MSKLRGWLFCGLWKESPFYVWQCVRCGIRRQCIAIPEDWHCPTCRKRGWDRP